MLLHFESPHGPEQGMSLVTCIYFVVIIIYGSCEMNLVTFTCTCSSKHTEIYLVKFTYTVILVPINFVFIKSRIRKNGSRFENLSVFN
jgi:hypothetical protein